MMLRERIKSVQKDVDEVPGLYPGSESGRSLSDVGGDSHKGGSLFSLSLSSLFWGFTRKASSDSESLRSPTSHLDHSLFSCLISPFRSPRSPQDGLQKFWDSSKVGLSVIDSVNQNANESVGDAFAQDCDSRNVLLRPKARVRPHNPENSVTENCHVLPNPVKSPLHKDSSSGVVFEIGCATDDPKPFLSGKNCFCLVDSAGVNCGPQEIKETLKSGNLISSSLVAEKGPFESLPEDELELSEDYTRVTSHGPNPKTTHIYGDCILDCHPKELSNDFEIKTKGLMHSTSPTTAAFYPTVHFLSCCCYTCKKFLEEGKDIYIYRGEKAFCSVECREEEILLDEEIAKNSRKCQCGMFKLPP